MKFLTLSISMVLFLKEFYMRNNERIYDTVFIMSSTTFFKSSFQLFTDPLTGRGN